MTPIIIALQSFFTRIFLYFWVKFLFPLKRITILCNFLSNYWKASSFSPLKNLLNWGYCLKKKFVLLLFTRSRLVISWQGACLKIHRLYRLYLCHLKCWPRKSQKSENKNFRNLTNALWIQNLEAILNWFIINWLLTDKKSNKINFRER